MTAFTYEGDLDHSVSAAVEQTIRIVLEEILYSQGLEGLLLNPGLEHAGDLVLYVLPCPLVKPGIAPKLLSDTAISVRLANADIPISATNSMTTSRSWARRNSKWPFPVI